MKNKCDLVTGEFGFDACIDYKAEGLSSAPDSRRTTERRDITSAS